MVARAEKDLKVRLDHAGATAEGEAVRFGPIATGVGSGETAQVAAHLHMRRFKGDWLIAQVNSQVVGSVRSYARLEEDEATYGAWLGAVRSGRTQVTTGPLLSLNVDGAGIGDTVSLDAPASVTAAATARSRHALDRLELVVGGEVHSSLDVAGERSPHELRAGIVVNRPTWIAARAHGQTMLPYQVWPDLTPEGIRVMAHTSPAHVQLAGMGVARQQALQDMIQSAERALHGAQAEANYRSEGERAKVSEIFRAAISRLEARLAMSQSMNESIPAERHRDEHPNRRERCPRFPA